MDENPCAGTVPNPRSPGIPAEILQIQPLLQRLEGVPIDLEVRMEPQSILRNTLLLFVATIVAAAATFAVVIWWVVRRGRRTGVPKSAAAGPDGPALP